MGQYFECPKIGMVEKGQYLSHRKIGFVAILVPQNSDGSNWATVLVSIKLGWLKRGIILVMKK